MAAVVNSQDRAKLYEQEMGANALARQQRAAAARCSSCQQPIRWVRTSNGKPMPVDYDPHEGGNILVDDHGGNAIVTEPGGPGSGIPSGKTLHYSHFATCPNADQHRKPR